MSPDSLFSYAERVLNSEEEALKFNMWGAKNGPDGEMNGCDGQCRRNMYCDLVTSQTDDEDNCGIIPGFRKTPFYGF